MNTTKLNKTIQSPQNVKIFCPCCGNEIISPRGELDTLITENAEKVREVSKKLLEVKEKIQTTHNIELLLEKQKLIEEQKKLNETAHKYKQKRANLSGYETMSAYTVMKKLILEKYGDKEYVDFMNEVMRRTQPQTDDDSLKIISIL